MAKQKKEDELYDHLLWDHKEPYQDNQQIDQIAQRVCAQYKLTSNTHCVVSFYPYAGLKSTIRIENNTTLMRLSDILEDAPQNVLESLLHILVARASRHQPNRVHQQIYNDYISRPSIERKHAKVRQKRNRKQLIGPQGTNYNLEHSFKRVNRKYFQNSIPQPQLSWSPGCSRTQLGYHDGHLNLIVISRWLDKKSVPRYVVDFIMYHEMLHIVIPTQSKNGRRIIHTAEFRRREQEFEEFDEVMKWLRRPRLRLIS
ncbi:MAG: SprT-like domain-containing protein [bacterium]